MVFIQKRERHHWNNHPPNKRWHLADVVHLYIHVSGICYFPVFHVDNLQNLQTRYEIDSRLTQLITELQNAWRPGQRGDRYRLKNPAGICKWKEEKELVCYLPRSVGIFGIFCQESLSSRQSSEVLLDPVCTNQWQHSFPDQPNQTTRTLLQILLYTKIGRTEYPRWQPN